MEMEIAETLLSESFLLEKPSFTACPPRDRYKADGFVTLEDSLTDFSVGDSSSPNASADDETKRWRSKYHDRERQCKTLQRENERINIDLAHERYKSNKLQKKLQFIRDHQEIFCKLKDAYVNMKYNEAAGNKMVTIHERSVQTYSGVLCCNCVDTETLREQLLLAKALYLDSVLLSKEDYGRMQDTLALLKRTVEAREKSWCVNLDRENKFKENIQALQGENEFLRDLLKNREGEKELRKSESEEFRRDKDTASLKKIVVKFERKFREKGSKHLGYPGFSEREKCIIEQLMSKYYSKLGKRIESRSLLCDRELLSSSEIFSQAPSKQIEIKGTSDVRIENPIAILDLLLERSGKPKN